MPPMSLFEKYGGFTTLYPLVGEFYDAVLDSEIVSYIFEPISMNLLIEHQTKFLAAMMGGPGEYDDAQLKYAHKKFNITEVEWNEVVSIFIEVLNRFDISEDDIKILTRLISSKKSLIVTG